MLVIGMKAESKPKDEPDVVSAAAPVQDTALVESRVLDLIGNLVEPGIVGVRSRRVNDPKGAKSGFVVIYVPASEGSPRRSRKDSKFYQRIGSGTFPMEYFQIEDMFGKRPHPKLELLLEEKPIGPGAFSHGPQRTFRLGISNVGHGLAKFPCIRFKRSGPLRETTLGLDGSGRTGLPQRASEGLWCIFQGGVDSVIYPGEDFIITNLIQDGKQQGEVGPEMQGGQWFAGSRKAILWHFNEISFSCEISSEGMPTSEHRASFEAKDFRQENY